MRLLAVLVVAAIVAGCLGGTDPAPEGDPAVAPEGVLRLDGGIVFHEYGRRANLSMLHFAEGPAVTVAFPEGVLVQTEDGKLVPPTEPLAMAAGDMVNFLPPYGASNLTVEVTPAAGAAQAMVVPLEEQPALFSGELVIELLKVQRDQFPHRSPGMPSYSAAIAYFAEWFSNLSYEVETDHMDTPGLPVPITDIQGGSFSSVVAYKRGTLNPERYIVFGGHFDVVEQTRDGAFDNTGGSMATMAIAKAFQNVTTDHTLVFALWGGEEDGILGSQGWITKHPQLVPFIDGYFNYDVTGLAWPAPKVEPSATVIAAGPDGPVADALHGYAEEIRSTWMQVEAEFVYETVAQGQATGAGVNAQSDHTPFMSRGIPVFFPFTARVGDVFAIIHSEVDTVDNLTKYALLGVEGMANEAPLTPEEIEEGEWYLARSFETQLALGFYWAVLTDAGHFASPARPPTALALL